jgi:hypothetical protein
MGGASPKRAEHEMKLEAQLGPGPYPDYAFPKLGQVDESKQMFD